MGLVTAGNDIVYTEEIHTYEERIGFKIDENYYEIVKGNKYDFIGSIRAQLVSILQCEPLNVLVVGLTSILGIVFFLFGDTVKSWDAKGASLLKPGSD